MGGLQFLKAGKPWQLITSAEVYKLVARENFLEKTH